MDITKLKAEEVIVNEFYNKYKESINFFGIELARLNANIYIINKIRDFPFDLFCKPDDTIFFSLVINNFFEYSIITITRMTTDNSSDFFTLLQFKNKLYKKIKPKYKDKFASHIKEVKFDKNIHQMLKKARNLRDERIAHIKKDSIFQTRKIDKMDYFELKELKESLNSLLDALAFNTDYLKLYSNKRVKHSSNSDNQSDIEKILDYIAKESAFLKIPEKLSKRKGQWEKWKKNASDKKIKKLNEYRKKFGFPEIK